MNGSVRKRPRKDGSVAWAAGYWVPDRAKRGGRRWVPGTFDTEAEARRWLRQELAKLDRGESPADPKMTLAQLCTAFLEVYDPPKEATWIIREQALRLHVIPGLGHIKLKNLDGKAIDVWIAKQKKTTVPGKTTCYRPSTIACWVAALDLVLEQAVRWKAIPRNPLEDASPPSPVPGPVDFWREEEALAFFGAHQAHPDRALWLVLTVCELRISEALALRWSDVDWERGILQVRRGLTRTKGERFAEGTPKTKASVRAVAVPGPCLEALRLHKEAQDERRRLLGPRWAGHVPGWVFDNGEGVRLHQETARGRFEASIKAAGVRRITLHALRHTGATGEGKAGVAPHVLAKKLGHSSPAFTMRVYQHALTEDQRDSGNRWADAITGRTG